ncbi:MAG: hypothetical protein DA408_17020 [Bacteroidetes bacterium]|nr:MAG: hypothetical protein C7N36_06455 [Bacteroidota bacterium]PTM10066.1 MAG: hypothetical protein DA408_17020 [Bacteroidota bacterium]
MLKKHLTLTGILIATVLLGIAIRYYPGGSQKDPSSPGYDWTNNYLSNLFSPYAFNGMNNSARLWAIGGVFFMSASFAVFFIQFSTKIAPHSAARVIKYGGVGATVFSFLTVTPWHDTMIIFASILGLVSFFYITVLIFKSRLHALKVFSFIGLLLAYGCNFIYYTRTNLEWLPVLQKVTLLASILWILALEYFTEKADFEFTGLTSKR